MTQDKYFSCHIYFTHLFPIYLSLFLKLRGVSFFCFKLYYSGSKTSIHFKGVNKIESYSWTRVIKIGLLFHLFHKKRRKIEWRKKIIRIATLSAWFVAFKKNDGKKWLLSGSRSIAWQNNEKCIMNCTARSTWLQHNELSWLYIFKAKKKVKHFFSVIHICGGITWKRN